MNLSKTQWSILNALPDGREPIEEVLSELVSECPSYDAVTLLEDLFALFKLKLIGLQQLPIRALGQEFRARDIIPLAPEDVVGDRKAEFDAFVAKGAYIRSTLLGDGARVGIPTGIYVQITPAGHAAWEAPEYRQYWPRGQETDPA